MILEIKQESNKSLVFFNLFRPVKGFILKMRVRLFLQVQLHVNYNFHKLQNDCAIFNIDYFLNNNSFKTDKYFHLIMFS